MVTRLATIAPLLLVVLVAAASAAHAAPGSTAAASRRNPMLAARVGWAYGIGGELELRPRHWGVTASGGWVPRYGPGGYLGAAWGAAPLGEAGVVAEAGAFYGQRNPLRSAPSGLGLYVLAGRDFAPSRSISLRLVAGGGIPWAAASWSGVEFLAKLTVGVALPLGGR